MIDIELITSKVKESFSKAEGGHDWHHTNRVRNNAIIIARSEDVNMDVVIIASLLHDIADAKFHNNDEEIGPQKAKKIMQECGIDNEVQEQVVKIIRNISFKNSLDKQRWTSKELEVVQDADRLEAIGAIGIARAFNYGGYKNLPLFDPDVMPHTLLTKKEYQSSKGPTINHFYEKLLKLKGQMNTTTGQAIAAKRHSFLITFLDQFYEEAGVIPQWHLKFNE